MKMDQGPHVLENCANKKSQRVKADESCVPALKDEAAEVDHLLAEPKSDHVSVDGLFCFNKENSGKCLGLEDFSCGFECGFRTNYGGMDPYNIQGEDDLNLEVLDGLLDDVDEVDDIHAANDLSTACGNFLLDIEFAENVLALDNCSIEGTCLGNSSSESHSPGFSGNSNVAIGISESSTGTVPESECKIDSLDKSKRGCQVPTEDKKCPSSSEVQKFDELDSKNCPNSPDVLKFDELDSKNCPNSPDVQKLDVLDSKSFPNSPDVQKLDELDSKSFPNSPDVQKFDGLDSSNCPKSPDVHKFDELDSSKCPSSPHVHKIDDLDSDDDLLLSSIMSRCKSKKRAKSSVPGTRVKRLSKPTLRYIEEFSELKSVYHMGGRKDSSTALEEKHLKVKLHNESFNETRSQAPSKSWSRQGRVKKRAPSLESESSDDYSASEFDDDLSASETGDGRVRKKKPKLGVDRRKHQRMWTLAEVMKLVDGISQYGVGKWTDIKRLLFPSSAYRTPIDLRDKWRNLLRSTYTQKKNKREVEPKHVVRTLPNHVIRRIHDLATIHPYPRGSNSKISCSDHAASIQAFNQN